MEKRFTEGQIVAAIENQHPLTTFGDLVIDPG